MDWTTPLKQQQLDFVKRLKSGHLLHCDRDYLYSEVTVIGDKILQELITDSKQIATKYESIYPVHEIFTTIFRGKLGEKTFLIRFGDLVTPILEKETLTKKNKVNFVLKVLPHIHIHVKSCGGNIEKIKWCFTEEEVKHSAVLVCLYCLQEFSAQNLDYSLILAGFFPTEMITISEQLLSLDISDLLYGGGLRAYLNSLGNSKSNYIALAKQCNNKGDYGGVIANYSKVLSLEPDNPKFYVLRGIARWKIGDQHGAISDYNSAIKINPNYDLAYHWRGYVLSKLGDFTAAIEDYTEEIRINILSAYAYYKRGSLYSKMNNHLAALDDYSTAIRINPNLYQVFYNRGNTRYELKDKQGALDDYNHALKLNPNLPQAYYSRAIVYTDLGDSEKAIADYLQAIRIMPNYDKAYYNLAILQADLGEYKSALRNYNKVIEINPDFVQAEYNRKALISYLKKEENILGDESSDKKHKVGDPYLVDSSKNLSNKNQANLKENKELTDPWGKDRNFPN
jgi:tetratricopeptide (TPR) repeat protein